MLLQATDLCKAYTDQPLLQNVSLVIQPGEKVALIGVNGCGKSTLLKILAGRESAEGQISTAKDAVIYAMPQVPVFEKETVWEQMESHNRKNRFPCEEFELKSVLTQLGFDDLQTRIAELSGGQQRKLSLAMALATDADLLMLDEPTNHLDNEMIAWLENWLLRFRGALLMVTHDRYFLERVCTRIVEIDHAALYDHPGSYQQYLEDKETRLQLQSERERKHQNLYRKELAWVRAGCQARSTKSKSRLARFEELRRQRFEQQEKQLELLSPSARLGRKTLSWKNLSFGYPGGPILFHDFSYQTKRNDRIGLVGPNGAGKSTFLKILAGELQPDTGVVETGSTVRIGYFRQDHEMPDMNMRVLEYIEESAREIETGQGTVSAGAMLRRFLFDKDKQYLPLSRLSGGERRRLYLLKVLMEAPNLLLLDEPTNDLDLITLEILEDYLDEFPGIVITVSHDRYFLDRVCSSLFELGPDKIWRAGSGGYSDLAARREARRQQEQEARKMDRSFAPSDQENRKKRPSGLSYMEKKELKSLPDTMEKLEAEIAALEASMNDQQAYAQLEETARKRDAAAKTLEEAEERWLELSERADAAGQRI